MGGQPNWQEIENTRKCRMSHGHLGGAKAARTLTLKEAFHSTLIINHEVGEGIGRVKQTENAGTAKEGGLVDRRGKSHFKRVP